MPKDLSALARDNAPRLAERCQDTISGKSGVDRDAIDAFVLMVRDEARVGVNMRPSVLASLLEGEPYRNMNELAERDALTGSIGYEQALRKRLGKWYDPRVAFEGEFERGREFKYAAVNVGTAGALRYNGVCAILKAESLTIVGLVPGDSLRRYVTGANVDVDRVRCEVGTWGGRCNVAVVKLHAEACGCSQDEWGRIVCSDDDYIEVICVERIGAEEVRQVRMAGSEEKRLREAVYALYAGGGDPTTNREAQALANVKGDLRKRGIQLEIIPDA